MGVNYGQLKQTTKAVWSLGDYRPIARLLEPAAHELIDACGVTAGQDLLDVAAGNGNCALAAARRGARVVASDLTPALVQLGRTRTQEEGLAIRWIQADAEQLPFAAGRFDCVTSVFGAMFAPRPEVVAAELFRILRSGGIVGMANWTPTSFGKQLVDVAARYAPPPPAELPSPFGWGEEQTARSLLAGLASWIRLEQRLVRWEFDSVAAMRAVFQGHGAAVMAKQTPPPRRRTSSWAGTSKRWSASTTEAAGTGSPSTTSTCWWWRARPEPPHPLPGPARHGSLARNLRC